MGCHSREFTVETLKEKAYFHRLSAYLIDQLVGLSCDQLSRFLRAVDAVEAGAPSTWAPGAFSSSGLLAGYWHFHFLQDDWMATNLAAAHRQPLKQPLDATVDAIADRIVAGQADIVTAQAEAVKKFTDRLSGEATGEWVIYREGATGREYLAIHAHTRRGSKEERGLKQLLDGIAI